MSLTRTPTKNGYILRGTLLDVSASNDGSWMRTDGCYPFSITVGGTFVGTVTVYGCNDETAPSDADNTQAVLWTTTTADTFIMSAPVERIKVAFVRTSGAVKATIRSAPSGV